MVTVVINGIRILDYEILNHIENNLIPEEQIVEKTDHLLLEYYSVARFEVLKIETTDAMRITRLSNVGDRSLFIGRFSVAGNYEGIFDKNCIYFVDGINDDSNGEYPLICREAVDFNIDDESIKGSFPSIKIEKGCCMDWFSPNIKVGALI
ncbi:hypothetical protein DITRI_Ditri08aG0150800 [Diplodiscus trichospermus]